MFKIPTINLKGIYQSADTSVSEVNKARGGEKSINVIVKIYDKDSNSIETTKGILSEDHYFLRTPYQSRLYMDTKPIWEDGKKTVYVSKRYHRTLDLTKIANVADALRLKAEIFTKNFEIKVENLQGSLDFSLFDNDFSSSFCSSSHEVLRAKSMEFLADVPKRLYILTAVIAGLFGVIVGGIGTLVLTNLIK